MYSFTNAQFVSKQKVVEYARRKIESNPVYLDTETTGLNPDDEIIEIAIVNSYGEVLFDSLIKPQKPIPLSATAINKISNEMVEKSPSWPHVWPEIQNLLLNHPIGMYNAVFDIRMILQTLKISNVPNDKKFNAFDIMKVNMDYMNSIRRLRLEQAGRNLGISIPNSHRAVDDTLLTRAVFHSIAGMQY